MSRPIARHADGSFCYTRNCRLGEHRALNAEREAFIGEVQTQHAPVAAQPAPQRAPITAGSRLREQEEARKQVEFKQEWRERIRGWKELGFQYPVSIRKAEHWVKYAVAGKEALAHLSDRQRAAIRFFTSNNYRWINAHIYGHGEALPSGERRSFESYDLSIGHSGQSEANPTREQAEELIPVLDEALTPKQAKARVLYRGVSRNALYKITEGAMNDEQFHAYVAENFKLGAEVQMAGYLSTSPSPRAAMGYANSTTPGTGAAREGIFFELLTRSGVNVSGASQYSDEAETLLPRNTRWKVAAVHQSKRLRHAVDDEYNKKYKVGPSTATVTLVQLVELEG